ncbi:MAG: tryptophan--tRNA ligase [Mycoplasmatales bacterium]
MIKFSGIQPSGTITLGNYLGALQYFKDSNKDDINYYCVVDLHALTTNKDKDILQENIYSLSCLYIALGLHEHANIFIQSHVKEHTELSWILQTYAKMGELERMTQYKDKKELNNNVGLFTYPVLMASDILLYDTTHVPIGKDQTQHLEFTKMIANKFNSSVGKDIFTIPEPSINKSSEKIYSLIDPTKKMSKSDENPKSYISILDDYKTLESKIKSATTDSVGQINLDEENQPGIYNLLNIYALCNKATIEDAYNKLKDANYGTLKQEVTTSIWEVIEPIQEAYNKVYEDKEYVVGILKEGKENASKQAYMKLKEVKEGIGLIND